MKLFRLFSAALLTLVPAVASAQPPTIWFAPRSGDRTEYYSDFSNLFVEPSQWANAQSHTATLLIAAQWFRLNTPAAVDAMIASLKRHNISLGIEGGVLTASSSCGNGIEGFNAYDLISAAQIVQQHGGTISYIAMDEPFFYGHIYTGVQACQWSAETIARNAAKNIRKFRAYFPNVIVGDTEPIDSTTGWSIYREFAKAYSWCSGRPLDFFRVDVDWNDPNWLSALENMEAGVRSSGIPFAVIYNGNNADKSNSAWMSHAINNFMTYEGAGGRPDMVSIQSWNNYPDHVLPETDATALTSLVDTYVQNSPAGH